MRQGLSDDDVPGRLAAVKAVGDLRDAESILALIDLLKNDEPPVRREAATALGRLGDAAAVPALRAALARPVDRFEEHAIIFALIEINDRESTLAGLASGQASVRRGTLIALDQMDAGDLTREQVSSVLSGADAPLLAAIVDVLGRHPQWADELATTMQGWIALDEPTAEQLGMLRGATVALVARPEIRRSCSTR